MNKDKQGLVIAFDGPDGVGKTTQLNLTQNFLKQRGISAHLTRFSGGTPLSKLLREVSLSDTPRQPGTDLYISLAMGVDLAGQLKTRKAAGNVCLVDRSPLTMLAYNVYGNGLKDRHQGLHAVDKLMQDWQLDVLLYFDAPQSILDKRRQQRTDKPLDYFEKLGTAFHQRVRQGYQAGLKYIESSEGTTKKLKIIDATGTIEEVQTTIQRYLETLL